MGCYVKEVPLQNVYIYDIEKSEIATRLPYMTTRKKNT